MRICSICGVEKLDEEFHKRKDVRDGFRKECKLCWNEKKRKYNLTNKENISEKKKIYYIKNRERIIDSVKKYRVENKEKISEYLKEYFKEYRTKNKESLNDKMNQYQKNRKKNDSIFKLKYNLRSKLSGHLKKNSIKISQRTFEILGCDIEEFRDYLEEKFLTGMSWENYGKWHLDHIIPISLAKTEEDVIKLNHYSNFQPLWALDNIIKRDKIINGN